MPQPLNENPEALSWEEQECQKVLTALHDYEEPVNMLGMEAADLMDLYHMGFNIDDAPIDGVRAVIAFCLKKYREMAPVGCAGCTGKEVCNPEPTKEQTNAALHEVVQKATEQFNVKPL